MTELAIGDEIKREICDSVAVGQVAVVSEGMVTVGEWTGVGYIISDPLTGSGAYRISGGGNGASFLAGFLITFGLIGMLTYAGPVLFYIMLTLLLIGLVFALIALMEVSREMNMDRLTNNPKYDKPIARYFWAFTCGSAVGAAFIALIIFPSLLYTIIFRTPNNEKVFRPETFLTKVALGGIGWLLSLHAIASWQGFAPCSAEN